MKSLHPPHMPPASAPWNTTSAPRSSAARVAATPCASDTPSLTISTTPRPAALSRARWRASWASPWRCSRAASSLSPTGAAPVPLIRARSSVVAWAQPAKRMRSDAERRTPNSLLCISPLPSALPPDPPARPLCGASRPPPCYRPHSVTKPVIAFTSSDSPRTQPRRGELRKSMNLSLQTSSAQRLSAPTLR